MAAFEGGPDEIGIAEVLVPSGFCIVSVDVAQDVELLQMQLTEKEAILDDRRLRVNAMEAALHARHHDERPIEDLFDIIYAKLLGGSVV